MRRLHKGSILSLLVALVLALPASGAETGEADYDVLVATIQANKKALVAVNMDLDDTEAAAFWPVYDRYQADLTGVRDGLAKIIEEYTANFSTMSDAEASRLLEDYLANERERAELREKYLKPFAEVLPGRKLARFYQIENKIQAVLRYELAREIPVIEQ
jgi:hypothetical protein